MTRVAIVHPLTLLGKELRQTIERRRPDLVDLRLLTSIESEVGTVTEAGGGAAFVTRADPEAFEDCDLAFFCGEIAADRALLAALPVGCRSIVLGAGASADEGRLAVAGVTPALGDRPRLVSPHPAVVGLAHLLAALRPLGVTSATATALQPASQRGEPGVDELFEQTRSIVAFSGTLPTAVFGRQLAFNVLPTGGEGALVTAQLPAVLGEPLPSISVALLYSGGFHGIGLSLALRFATLPTPAQVAHALASDALIEVRRDPRTLGPIDAAQSEKILVGEIRAVTPAAPEIWLWAVLDNLTVGGAHNALALLS